MAAKALREKRLHRASVSRAYYAAYSEITAELVGSGVQSFGRFRNPEHANLPMLVKNKLTRFRVPARSEIAKAIRQLRNLREDADYRPSSVVEEHESREALRGLELVRRALGRGL